MNNLTTEVILEDKEIKILSKLLDEALKDIKLTINSKLNNDITELSNLYDDTYRLKQKFDNLKPNAK